MSTVSDLLAQSRAAHARKKQAAGRADRHGRVTSLPNYVSAEHHIADALHARLSAEAFDPGHADTAWQDDAVETRTTSAHLIAFFRDYLVNDAYSNAYNELAASLTETERQILHATGLNSLNNA